MATFRGVSFAVRTAAGHVRSKCTLKPPVPQSLVEGGYSTSTPVGGKGGYLPTPKPMAAPILKRPDSIPEGTIALPIHGSTGFEKLETDALLSGVTDVTNCMGTRPHWGTEKDPVLVPTNHAFTEVLCMCDGDTDISHEEWVLYPGRPQRCGCGCVFKLFPVVRSEKIDTPQLRPYSYKNPLTGSGVI